MNIICSILIFFVCSFAAIINLSVHNSGLNIVLGVFNLVAALIWILTSYYQIRNKITEKKLSRKNNNDDLNKLIRDAITSTRTTSYSNNSPASMYTSAISDAFINPIESNVGRCVRCNKDLTALSMFYMNKEGSLVCELCHSLYFKDSDGKFINRCAKCKKDLTPHESAQSFITGVQTHICKTCHEGKYKFIQDCK